MNNKQLNEAAREHAKGVLGEEQFKKNKLAAKSIAEDFKAGYRAALSSIAILTPKLKGQHAVMLKALTIISKEYQSPKEIKKNSEKQYGLDYEEALEMSYENIQLLAKYGAKGVKPLV